jgi:hypothetical protein
MNPRLSLCLRAIHLIEVKFSLCCAGLGISFRVDAFNRPRLGGWLNAGASLFEGWLMMSLALTSYHTLSLFVAILARASDKKETDF